MVRRVIFDKERVNPWVAERVGRNSPWEGRGYQAFGIEKDGELIGGVVIDSIVAGVRCSIHCAGEGRRWLTRELLFIVFDYVFRQLDCKVAINTVDADNEPSLRFTTHIGFTELARVPEGAGDCDLVILTLPRNNCCWHKMRA